MSIEEFVNENNYYVPLKENFQGSMTPISGSISLTDPNNIFELQNSVSDKLNVFQTKYARYIKCQDPSTSQNLNPVCNNNDNFENITVSYNDLLNSIDKLNSSYEKQIKVNENMNEEQFKKTMEKIQSQYREMTELRRQLDNQLANLQYNLENGKESPKQRLDSTILGYILWIILATCLIYFVLVG